MARFASSSAYGNFAAFDAETYARFNSQHPSRRTAASAERNESDEGINDARTQSRGTFTKMALGSRVWQGLQSVRRRSTVMSGLNSVAQESRSGEPSAGAQ